VKIVLGGGGGGLLLGGLGVGGVLRGFKHLPQQKPLSQSNMTLTGSGQAGSNGTKGSGWGTTAKGERK